MFTQNIYKNIYSSLIHRVKTWIQPKCPSPGEWLYELWYVHAMENHKITGTLDTTQVSFTRWTVIWAVVCPHNGKPHHKRESGTHTCNNLNESELCWVKKVNGKKLQTAWFHLQNILWMIQLQKWRPALWLSGFGARMRVGGKGLWYKQAA